VTRWLTIPDMQVPDQDRRSLNTVLEFIRHIKPDGLLIVGDELDAPSPSKWSRGRKNEYASTLQDEIDECRGVLASFRQALGPDESKPIHLMRSNHGERIRNYINSSAPALDSIRALGYERLLGLEDMRITYHTRPFEFAPNWLLAHGDEGSMIQTPGGTAMGLAKKWGKSVICGHTHRAGVQHHHTSVNGKITAPLYGIETGHLMAFGDGSNKADYLKAGSANWQQAVTLFDVDGKHVTPHLLLINNHKLHYDGSVFG